MKRKIVCVITVCFVALSGCGSSESSSRSIDKTAQKVIDDINGLGEIGLEDAELIEKIEKSYNVLTKEQKDQIDNYSDLLDARNNLDLLIEEENQKRKEEIKAKEEEEKKKLYTDEVKFCVKAILTVKGMLKNPNSMKLCEFAYNNGSDKYSGKYKYNYIYLEVSEQTSKWRNTKSIYLVTDDPDFYTVGSLRPEFMLRCALVENVDSATLSLWASCDSVNHNAVYQLLEEYEKTNDISLLD